MVHAAIEEIRYLSGHSVIAAIEAKIDSQSARIDVQITELKAEIKAQTARIDVLQRVIWRVIWPLIVLLAASIFGLLYKALTG